MLGGWWLVGVKVGVGCLGGFGVLPLRLVGAEEEEEAIGRNGCCGIVFLSGWVTLREKCRCHCDSGDVVNVGGILPCPGCFVDDFLALVLVRHIICFRIYVIKCVL